MSKIERRTHLKAQLSLLDEEQFKTKSSQLSKNLSKLLSDLNVIQENILIGAFAPFDREPFWGMHLSEDVDKLTAFPAFEKMTNSMSFKKAAMKDLLMKKDFGASILGPRENAETVIPGVILVPGLAFNTKGERLGRGKGFYDRYLAKFSGTKIGLCFSIQLDDSLPVEEHDVLMDFIVTEEKIINCKRA